MHLSYSQTDPVLSCRFSLAPHLMSLNRFFHLATKLLAAKQHSNLICYPLPCLSNLKSHKFAPGNAAPFAQGHECSLESFFVVDPFCSSLYRTSELSEQTALTGDTNYIYELCILTSCQQRHTCTVDVLSWQNSLSTPCGMGFVRPLTFKNRAPSV